MNAPQHTLFTFDLRPFKAAVLHVIDECAADRLSVADAIKSIETLAATVPDLDEKDYVTAMSTLVGIPRKIDRAKRLVNCLSDHTLRPWVVVSFALSVRAVGLAALALFVWFIVWLAS